MPEIKHQQLGASPQIEVGEIHIPDDADMGTGTFTTVYKARALRSNDAVTSIMLKAPEFQISVTVNRNGDVPVLLGRTDSEPASRITYRLPQYVSDAKHTIRVDFVKWHIMSATYDGKPMAEATPPARN
jgi:hypothetical protein